MSKFNWNTWHYIAVAVFVLYYAFDLQVSVVLNRILNTRLPHPEPSRIKKACGEEKETQQANFWQKLDLNWKYGQQVKQKGYIASKVAELATNVVNCRCTSSSKACKYVKTVIAELCDVASSKCVPDSRGWDFQLKVKQKDFISNQEAKLARNTTRSRCS